MQPRALQISGFKQRKAVVAFARVGNQGIEGLIGTFQDQLIENIIWCAHALVPDAHISLHDTIGFVIIWRVAASCDRQCEKIFIIFLKRCQHKLHQWRDAIFDESADCFSVGLCVIQTGDRSIITDAKKQRAADSVGKSADAFKPALWFILFHSNFELIFCCLNDESIKHLNCSFHLAMSSL